MIAHRIATIVIVAAALVGTGCSSETAPKPPAGTPAKTEPPAQPSPLVQNAPLQPAAAQVQPTAAAKPPSMPEAAPKPATFKEAQLTLQDLANRPERWPDMTTIKEPLDFGAFKVTPGQKFKVVSFTGGNEITLDAGQDRIIPVSTTECDFLEAANLAWTSFTPEQRKLDLKTIYEDSSLWPEKVKSSGAFTLNDGRSTKEGDTFDLVSISPQETIVYSAELNARLVADLGRTDTIARARELAAIERDKRPARVVNWLAKSLVGADGKPIDPKMLEGKNVFALYASASWCAPCRGFTPSFVKYVTEAGPKNPHLMTVLLSLDDKNEDMLKYMTDDKMPYPALPKAALNKSPACGYLVGGIPHLIIVDKYGKVLANSYRGTQSLGPQSVLQALPKILETSAQK